MKTFIEMGAADFDTLMPLAHAGWYGRIVEPIPFYCRRLREQLIGTSCEVIQGAVAGQKRQQRCYFPSEYFINDIENNWGPEHQWMKGIGTFERPGMTCALQSQVAGWGLDPRTHIDDINMTTMLLDEVIEGMTHIDFLKSDTEGCELEIFSEYSWRLKPPFLKVEHRRMDNPDYVTEPLKELLISKNYHIWEEKDDLYGVLKDV